MERLLPAPSIRHGAPRLPRKTAADWPSIPASYVTERQPNPTILGGRSDVGEWFGEMPMGALEAAWAAESVPLAEYELPLSAHEVVSG